MRRVTFRVPAGELDRVLDGLLPVLPGGVQVTEGDPDTAIAITAVVPPDAGRVAELAGRPPRAWREEEVSPDGRERRLAAGVRVGDLIVRPPAAPEPPPGTVDVVVEPRSLVFGSGSHPTTRMCLELLRGLEPAGGLADLGCGLGTLAIAGAKLGFDPVVAVDRQPEAAEAAAANAALNGVGVRAEVVDLVADEPPWQPTLLVNTAPDVQAHVVERLPAEVATAIVSSFVEAEADGVLARWAAAGFTERDRRTEDTWVAVRLERTGSPAPAGAGPAAVEPAREPGAAIPLGQAAGPDPGEDPILPQERVLDPGPPVRAGAALGQLATRLPDGGLVVSSARTVEVGSRSALLYVPSLFRFDLTPAHETLGVALRPLIRVPHAWEADADSYDGFRREAGRPIVFRGRFDLPDGSLGIWIQVLTISDDDQGATHVIAKAAVRPIDVEG